jgi:hypothetical protein
MGWDQRRLFFCLTPVRRVVQLGSRAITPMARGIQFQY